MSEAARLLDIAADRLLARHLPANAAGRMMDGWSEALFAALKDSGLALTQVPEEQGGSGGDLADAGVVAWRWGYHAAPLPIVALMLGPRAAALAGLEAGGSALLADRRIEPGRDPGESSVDLPALPSISTLLALAGTGTSGDLLVLDATKGRPIRDLAGEAWLRFERPADAILSRIPLPAAIAGELLDRGMLLAASQAAGAMAWIIAMVIEHANTRQQFGRPLGKFQAVQMLIAEAASEQVVAQAAIDAAIGAFDCGAPNSLLTLSAKVQAGRAATIVAAMAHQVLGAIGFTAEHLLGQYSRRLWDLRDRWGHQGGCAEAIGRAAAADPRGLWRHLVE